MNNNYSNHVLNSNQGNMTDNLARMADDEQTTWPRVTKEEMHNFVRRCMKSVGMQDEWTEDLADVLVTADYRGHYSHGLNRLGKFVLK